MALVSTVSPLATQPFQQTAGPTTGPHLAPVKDSRWLTLELCREFQRGKCSRTDAECKYAHPPPHVEVQNGRVVCCYDSIKGKCQRKEPPCKYLHPPQHLKEQLLQNGRNNLLMKNLQLQMAGLTMPVLPGMVPMPVTYSSCDGSKSLLNGYSTAVVHGQIPVVTHPYMLQNSLTLSPYMTPMTLSANGMTVQPVDGCAVTSGGASVTMSSAAVSIPANSAPLAKATRTESAPPTISSTSLTNGCLGDQVTPWTTTSIVSAANPYSPIYYQNMSGMVPVMKRPLVNGEVKNGLHVYQTAPPAPYPQAAMSAVHLSQMQPTYVPVTLSGLQAMQQQQPAHY